MLKVLKHRRYCDQFIFIFIFSSVWFQLVSIVALLIIEFSVYYTLCYYHQIVRLLDNLEE